MKKEFAAIKDAMDKKTGDGRDHDKAIALADKYVKAHPEEFAEMQNLTLEQCVKNVETFRETGQDDWEMRFEVWLLHHFEPQNIGGAAEPTVRLG